VSIGRALMNAPAVVLADEPTGNLDADTTHSIMDLLWSINAKEETAVLMVTHNQSILSEYPARVLICEDTVCRELFHEE
jgi:ABC-type lipoprotein export system ATPase subunit